MELAEDANYDSAKLTYLLDLLPNLNDEQTDPIDYEDEEVNKYF